MNASPILTIAGLTFHEARRRRVLLAGLVLGLLFVAVYAIGFYFVNQETLKAIAESQQRGRATSGLLISQMRALLTTAGLYAANFLVIMMAVLAPVDTLSGEIASGAIQTLVTKPVRRADVLLGKWLGFFSMLLLYLALMVGGVLASVWLISGYMPPNILAGLGLILLEGTLLMTLSIAGGTRLSTLANGVTVFGLYGLAFIGGWVEQIGALIGNETARYLGVLSSLLVPSDALWQLASYQMQSPLIRSAVRMPPFAPASVPSAWMVAWALGYLVLVLGLALWSFRLRDL